MTDSRRTKSIDVVFTTRFQSHYLIEKLSVGPSFGGLLAIMGYDRTYLTEIELTKFLSNE